MNIHLKDHARAQIAHIHAALRELKDLAEAERFDMLSHLLAMAYLESGDILRGQRPSRHGAQPLAVPGKVSRSPFRSGKIDVSPACGPSAVRAP